MKLYYYQAACSFVVRIVLNELGLSFEDEAVDLRTKKTLSGADFYLINPKGLVPALCLDNGDVLTENQAILQYLVDSTPGQTLLAPVGDMERYHTLEWLNFMATELHKSLGMFYNPVVSDAHKKEVLMPLIIKRFSLLNDHLEGKAYIMGEVCTLPDAYLFVMLLWARYFKMDLSSYTSLAEFSARMHARPAVRTSLEQEHLLS